MRRSTLATAGLTRDEIDVRIARGQLHPVHRGVPAVGHRSLSREGRWLAAVLARGKGAVLSHGSAAALWGLAADDAARGAVPRAVRPGGGPRRPDP